MTLSLDVKDLSITAALDRAKQHILLICSENDKLEETKLQYHEYSKLWV